MKIGLTTNRERILISCSGAYRVMDAGAAKAVWKDAYRDPVTIGIRGARPTEGRIYRAQIGSFENRDAAETLAARLRSALGVPVVTAWAPERRAWRIRAGEADSREGLAPVVSRLRAEGYDQIWIAEEPVPQTAEARLVLVDSGYHVREAGSKILAVEPDSSRALLSVDGRAYRGSLEIRIDLSGALRVVNVLPVEVYLRGVVPAELGPAVYPELDALKAQAVAARTYVYRNVGQYEEEGYDICDTPRCQVYEGVKAEHPLSNRAVEETAGEIISFQGQPINALYTSTCGGHTEDAAGIFPEDAAPYLLGVPCAPEEGSRKARRILLTGSAALAGTPAPVAEAAALLKVHGLALEGVLGPTWLADPIGPEEAARWIDRIGRACGLGDAAGSPRGGESSSAPRDGAPGDASWNAPPEGARARAGDAPRGTATDRAEGSALRGGSRESRNGAMRPPKPEEESRPSPSVASLARQLVDRLHWMPRVELLVAREDAASWLPDEESPLSAEEAASVAYFLREKSWPHGSSGEPEPERQATRGDLARLLEFASRSCDLFSSREGIVRGREGADLRLSERTGSVTRAIDPRALMFADFGSGAVPVHRLGVVPGDKLRYHLGAGDRIDELLLLPGRQGISDDRYSNVSTWSVAYSAEDLAKRLDGYLGSGTLLDVAAVRRGVSGRVTELKVVGSGGGARIKGFDIRTALGLKDNLFTIDAQRDPGGVLRRVVFTGRGWGHGVGMCQVGAYGMALRGASYRSILGHYYSGTTVERLP